jgi:hypothetical protein
MSTTSFLTNENVNLLWEVLKEEEILKNQNQNTLNQIVQIFRNNLQGFYESERNKCISLVDINKKYIIIILKYINQNYPINLIHNEKLDYQINPQPIMNKYNPIQQTITQPNITQPNRIQIHKEAPEKELITVEEFKKEKRGQFNKDYNKRQEDFSNAMTLPIPPVPDFSDKYDDKPILEIEEEIKKITAQRNYDIEQINKSYNKQSYDNNWLNSSGTSIKNDKLPIQNHPNHRRQLNEGNIKFIKIEDEILDDNIYKNQIIELNAPKKNISWANNIVEEYTDLNDIYENNEIDEINEINELSVSTFNYENESSQKEDNNLFNKLKKKPVEKQFENNYNKINEKPVGNKIINEESINEKSINEESINEDSVNEDSINKKTNNKDNDINILKKEIENINNKIDIILNIIKK